MKTQAQWQALSEGLAFRHQAYINGQFQDAASGETFASVNPANQQLLTNVASCDSADVDVAVAAAKAAYESGVWADRSPKERKQVLLKLADLMEQHKDELALLDTLDMGKSITDTFEVDVPEAIDSFRWTAECIDKLYGEIAPTGNDILNLISREPVGVVAAITPWNYPLLMATFKVAPALAAGNSVILKPSEKSPLSVLLLAQLASEAGIPDGVFNVLPGFGHTAGKALALHNDVHAIAFTGSTRVAGMLMQYAGESNLKRVWLEAGGKSANIIFADCEDIQVAAEGAAEAIFSNQGEVCVAGSRLYVQNSIKQEFMAALLEAAKAYQPQNPLNPDCNMGPLVDAAQLQNVARFVEGALQQGGRLLLGGVPSVKDGEGFYAQPTIIDNANHDMTFVQEEIFGPVLAVMDFETEEQAIALANDSKYGLGASIWTANLSRAHRVSRKIRSGMVWVNTWGEGDSTMPFGGIKASGNGRDNSLHALEKFSELKSVLIRFE